MLKKIIMGIVIFLVLGFTGLLPAVIIFGFPLALVYAIYKAVIGIMTHNAELKERERERIGRDL